MERAQLAVLQVALGALAVIFSVTVQATALGDLAAQMKPGEWRELATNGFNDILLPTFAGSGESPIIEFSDKAVRNPLTRRIYFLGCARGDSGGSGVAYVCSPTDAEDAGFIQYDEDTNSWSRMPAAPVSSAPHAYNHAAMNPSTGDFFYIEHGGLTNPKLWKYSAGQWTTLPRPPNSNSGYGALEVFPEMKSLVYIDGGAGYQPKVFILPLSGANWSSVDIVHPLGQDHNFSRYSAIHKILFFGGGMSGGAGLDRVLLKMDSQGRITRGADSPVSLGVFGGSGRQVVDPISGNLLAFETGVSGPGTGSVYSYDPSIDQWSKHGTHPLGTLYGQVIAIFVAVPEHGVVMAVNYRDKNNKVYLYKHSVATGAPVGPVTPPVPTGLRVR